MRLLIGEADRGRATYPGTGAAVVPSATARQADSDFPANQAGAYDTFKAAISEYPPAPPASAGTKGAQSIADADWWAGTDTAGRDIARISMPTLIADGVADQLALAANDHILARLIPRHDWCSTPMPGMRSCFRKERPSLPASSRS